MGGRKYFYPLKKVFRIIGWTLAGIAIFVSFYFGAAWCCSRIAIPAEKGAAREVTIFIKTNGAHTDIVVPVRNEVIDWSCRLPYSNNVSPDTVYSYLGLGWGDKGFFLDMPTWDDLTLRLAFKASFWLNSTAMHATYYREMTGDGTERRIEISREQYARLVAFIQDRFTTDPDGRFINIPTTARYGLTDAFYETRGRYNLFYTCNTWTNCALAAAGQRHCLWTIFDKGMFLIYDRQRDADRP